MTTTKNYGPGVSGYLDPEGRNWDTTVYQASKPVLDKELNLVQDIEQLALRSLQRKTFPSGWLSDSFLNSSLSEAFVAGVAPNSVQLGALTALVNGWVIPVVYTGTASVLNQLSLGAGPAGAGAQRTDLVILEVWRRLIPAAPTTTGKSPAGRIWVNGNVKVPSGSDLLLNFADDLLDLNVGTETTKRVQIQYRLRVITGIDIFGHPYGIDDPTVLAHTVPASAAAPDGSATSFGYVNQSSSGDPGLWVAGNGDPANALGTVDGFMYGLPLVAVFRRNTTAFARNTNLNGGVAFGGASDRPDGLFHDLVVTRDVLDLRSGVSPSGWDGVEVLQKNVNFVFDNSLQTEVGSIVLGGGSNGHTVLWADEVGITNGNGGDGVTTGDTPAAEFIGQFDAVRRRFSDRVIYEHVVLRFTPSGTWSNGDTINISPTALPIWPYAAFNWASYAPANVSIVDIKKATFMGEGATQRTVDLTAWHSTGLGGVPQGTVAFKIETLPTLGTGSEPLYIHATIAYPAGGGLTKTPTNTYAGSIVVNNPVALPTTTPFFFPGSAPYGITPVFNFPNREVELVYETASHTRQFFGVATTTIPMPERVASGTVSITVNAVAYVGLITVSTDGYTLSLGGAAIGNPDTVIITYRSWRPMPQNNEQLTVYYESRLPQTARTELLGVSMSVTTKQVAQQLYILTAGSGSDGQAYPFPTAYVQAGGVYPTSGGTFTGDHELDGDLRVSLTTLFADTGFMQTGVNVPVVPLPENFALQRSTGDIDAEGRSFFKTITSGYLPLAVAQTLSDPKKHKNILPMLCALAADGPLGFKGQLVLVMLSRWAPFDDSNSIAFVADLTQNTTVASIYRLKGYLLDNRRS